MRCSQAYATAGSYAAVPPRGVKLESARGKPLRIETLALWLTYAASASFTLWLAGRLVGAVPARAALVLALLPLVFTGKAMLLGRVYGSADLYFTVDPWRSLPAAAGVGAPRNSILSDLAFANLPWRAAVKEALANGRLPLWNRFALAGTPLLPAAQAGILHPSTLLSLGLPLALSWTFSCTFTLFLALLCGFLFFRDFELDVVPSLLGAAAWAFSTYLLFWIGWSVGSSAASLPLLLLGARRLARAPGRGPILVTAAALWLSICGGHPETAAHGALAAGALFLFELLPARGGSVRRAVSAGAVSAVLALLLSGPQLFPLLEILPRSAEFRARREALARGGGGQSAPVSSAVSRLLPDLLPFAHGIYGKSPMRTDRGDGSGMPIGYAGAVCFPLAGLAFRGSRRFRRGCLVFSAAALAGLLYGASMPGLIDLTSKLPGLTLALNYRLVLLTGLGLGGLAALGTQRLLDENRSGRALAWACGGWALAVSGASLISRGVFRERGLSEDFVLLRLAFELAPLLLLLAAALLPALRGAGLATAALLLLVAQRGVEMAATYPTLPAWTLAPPLPTLSSVPLSSEPCRVVAAGETLRPNGATLYGLEDVRGYESLILDRFTDTYPLWSTAQTASYNRVTDLTSPFLSFLNVCWAVAGPEDSVPAGWREQARGREMAVFWNAAALPRAFVPRRLRRIADAQERLAAMSRERDFAQTAWVSGPGAADEANGDAAVTLRAVGPDLVIDAQVASPVVIATSIPDWPGWVAREGTRTLPTVTVNHAFVAVLLPAGDHTVRLAYRPRFWGLGVAAAVVGAAAAAALAASRRNPAGIG